MFRKIVEFVLLKSLRHQKNWGMVVLVAACATFVLLADISVAQATTYRLRIQTIGRATQSYRSDLTVVAPRTLTQTMSLSAFNLADDQRGTVSAQLSVRYFGDFGLEQRLRNDPLFSNQWNSTTLDLAYVNWRPFESLNLRLGRQWTMGVLGVRDFDGLIVRWEPADNSLASFLEIYGGRDVELGLTRWDSSSWDAQGLPMNDTDGKLDSAPWHWLTGAQAAASLSDVAHIAVGYQRRFRNGDDGKTIIGDERLGAAWSASPMRSLGLNANVSYHTLLGAADAARFGAVWRLPIEIAAPTLSVGIEHRRPIFDSASIFNLFGAQPYQGLFASAQVSVDKISTEFEVRSWARMYHGADPSTLTGWTGNPGDSQAIGFAVAHRSNLRIGQRLLTWSTQLSQQLNAGESYGGDQFFGESRLRAPLGWQKIHVFGRGLVLIAWPEHHRHDPGYAITGVLGADFPLSERALLSLASEMSFGSFYPANSSLFVTFKLETGQ